MTDDQNLSSLVHLPHIRDLAAAGTFFSHVVATTPQCCPSRATFLTGQYAHNHGVLSNKAPDGGYPVLDSTRTLPVWLSEAGYRTGHVGRYLNGYGESKVGTDPLEIPLGWDEWRVPVEHTGFQMWNYTMNENGTLNFYGDSESDYQTDVLARMAEQFVLRNSSRREPFFLSVATLAPHKEGVLDNNPDAPRNPRPAPRHLGALDDLEIPRALSYDEVDVSDKPRSVSSRVRRLSQRAVEGLEALNRSRVESLLAVDDLVDRLIRALQRSGELENTLVIFTSDQGFLFGEHRLVGKGTIYEGAVRVPLIFRGPGIAAGAVRNQLVANVDLAPTILDAAAVKPDVTLDGSSLLAIAADDTVPDQRSYLLELQAVRGVDQEPRGASRDPREFYDPDTSGLRDRAYSTDLIAKRSSCTVAAGITLRLCIWNRSRRASSVFAVRSPQFMYAEHSTGEVELYDLERDPDQLVNVSQALEYRNELTALADRLQTLKSCRGAVCR
jgi:N-acetylglucosamine-6-sulfatase